MRKFVILSALIVCFNAQTAYSSDITDYFFNQNRELSPYYNRLSHISTKSTNVAELLKVDIGKELIKRARLDKKYFAIPQIEKRYSLIGKIDHFQSIRLVSIDRVALPENPEQLLFSNKIVLVKGDITGNPKKNEIIAMFGKIKDFIGTAYKKGGNGVTNIDCSDLVKKVFASLGVEMPRVSRSQFDVGKKIDISNLIPGDLVFFKIRKNAISHVGIYLGENKFVHASPRKGVMISDINEKYFKKYFVGATRVLTTEPE